MDVLWTIVQELTLSGPLVGLLQLLRDGETPVEFLDTASSAAQMLLCIIPQASPPDLNLISR